MARSNRTHAVSDGNFAQEVLQAPRLTVVDFWAEWCGPCRVLSPSIDAVAEEYGDQVKVTKMNVDENPETPSRFNIRGIPTVLFFRNGKLVDQIVGAVPKDVLSNTIQMHLPNET